MDSRDSGFMRNQMATLAFFGTSDSQGVPKMLCRCTVCTSTDPVNVRKRSSACIHTNSGHLLIDVGPDFRQQFLRYDNDVIPDTALITHAHNDHIAGIGDYADLCFWNDVQPKIISPPDVIEVLKRQFPYLMGRGVTFIPSCRTEFDEWRIDFHKVNHGYNGYSYGIRFEASGDSIRRTWAYVSDAFNVTEEQIEPFRNLDLLILGTSFWLETLDVHRRSVYDVQEALYLRGRLEAKRMVLTHLSHDVDVALRRDELPPGVTFAFDGMRLELP